MNITLQCAYCGNEDHKMDINTPPDELVNMTIKCDCGRWLVRDGIMGHIDNIRAGDMVKQTGCKVQGEVTEVTKDSVTIQMGPLSKTTSAKQTLIDWPKGNNSTE